MAIWNDALKELSGALTEEFGQPLIHRPMWRPPNERPQPHPERSEYELCGIFDSPEGAEDLHSNRQDGSGHTWTDHQSVTAYVSVANCDLKHPLSQADRIVVVETGDTYEVERPIRDAPGRTKASLNIVGKGGGT